MAYLNPTSPYQVGEAILAIVQAELEAAAADDLSEPLVVAYVGAGVVAYDYCCGQLVVTPEEVFRYLTFPVRATDRDLSCHAGSLGVELSVLLLRCVPVIDEGGNAPDPEALAQAHLWVHEDAARVWNVLGGVMPDEEWETAGLAQRFLGAEGGCIAVETRLTLGLGIEEWCVDGAA